MKTCCTFYMFHWHSVRTNNTSRACQVNCKKQTSPQTCMFGSILYTAAILWPPVDMVSGSTINTEATEIGWMGRCSAACSWLFFCTCALWVKLWCLLEDWQEISVLAKLLLALLSLLWDQLPEIRVVEISALIYHCKRRVRGFFLSDHFGQHAWCKKRLNLIKLSKLTRWWFYRHFQYLWETPRLT